MMSTTADPLSAATDHRRRKPMLKAPVPRQEQSPFSVPQPKPDPPAKAGNLDIGGRAREVEARHGRGYMNVARETSAVKAIHEMEGQDNRHTFQ